MIDSSNGLNGGSALDCQGQANGIGKIGHCLNIEKTPFFSKETLAKITSRVSKEEHEKALERIVELETQLGLNDKGYEQLVQKNVDRLISDLTYHINMYGWNQMLGNLLDVSDISDKLAKFFINDFEERLAVRNDPRNAIVEDDNLDLLIPDINFFANQVKAKIRLLNSLELCTTKKDSIDLILAIDEMFNEFIAEKSKEKES